MAWQRKIPFGYAIRNGKEEIHPTESQAVRDIFRAYLSGHSYSQIAREMEQKGIKYHQHTDQWNKHMVKRILENETYLGGRAYPRLIDSGDFLAVRLKCSDKTIGEARPREIDAIREKAVCASCGARMARDTRYKGQPTWRCQNGECGQIVRMEDGVALKTLDRRLRELATLPHLLTLPKAKADSTPSMDAVRIQRELDHAMNRGSESRELARILIFAAAAEAYEAIPDPTPQYWMARLREKVAKGPVTEDILRELLETAVTAIRIGKDGELALVLASGAVVEHNEKEISA